MSAVIVWIWVGVIYIVLLMLVLALMHSAGQYSRLEERWEREQWLKDRDELAKRRERRK